jgi:hypothetical protein
MWGQERAVVDWHYETPAKLVSRVVAIHSGVSSREARSNVSSQFGSDGSIGPSGKPKIDMKVGQRR